VGEQPPPAAQRDRPSRGDQLTQRNSCTRHCALQSRPG